jgi:hypothetical protein
MKGGSPEKDAIKVILGITRGTPDSYNPERDNLKEYYIKLLEIYNLYWREKDYNSKQALTEEFTGKKSWSLFRSRGNERQRVYRDLFSDLHRLDGMAIQLERDPDLYDFSGKTLIIYSDDQIYSCLNFGFNPIFSLGDDREDIYPLDQVLEAFNSTKSKERRERRERRERSRQILNPSELTEPSEPTGSNYQRNLLARIKQLEEKINEIEKNPNHPDRDRLDILKEAKRQLEEESHLGKDMNKQPPLETEGGTSRHRRRGANKKSLKGHKIHKSRKSRCSRR